MAPEQATNQQELDARRAAFLNDVWKAIVGLTGRGPNVWNARVNGFSWPAFSGVVFFGGRKYVNGIKWYTSATVSPTGKLLVGHFLGILSS